VSIESLTKGLEKLIAKFNADSAHYLSKAYGEAQARIDFITPFFKVLGWDVENEAGLPHDQREVIVERGETEGRPDYNFRLGGQTKFFVEAKAPSEPLDSARHILQAKSYAWNTKQVFFVILTDFEEFRFYDASIQPDERKPDEGLLLTLKYTEYLTKAEKLWEFSKDRVAAGSLDAMLPRDRRTQRLRIPVDEAFLDEMTGWREDLARNIYRNNPGLTAKQLNEVVQRLLDRIVFIRIAEDRNIIAKYQLREAKEYWESRGGKFDIFEWLNPLFQKINEDFNGEIFKPHLSESIKIDSEVLARIIERLYPPKSPYRFDVIGVELLGSIYERYLGKTIRPTAKTVRVEEKPEVRKAGGVYYTPKYIVDYIVKNTVGKVIEGKTPKQIEKIRILDPACGSGSFLIGAFQYLIDYHVRYLTAHPKEAHIHPLFPDLIPDGNGGHRLSVRLKAKILRHNLFGVDIDPQAVEITMMSLYLKALEGEKSQLPPKQSLLPELKYNIICGNSLIGPDIYDQGTLFADEERDRINAFDWYADHGVRELAPAFEGGGKPPHSKPAVIDRRYSTAPTIGDIMRAGGFDCVIGNPPYLYSAGQNYPDYFKANYRLSGYQTDFYVYFIERSLWLARSGGKVSFIVSDSWLKSESTSKLRAHLLSENRVNGIAVFDYPVFEQATLENSIFVLTRSAKPRAIAIDRFASPESVSTTFELDPADALDRGLIDPRLSSDSQGLLKLIEQGSRPLDQFVKINRGIHAYRTDGYGKSKFGPGPQTKKDKDTRSYHANRRLDETYLRELKGKDVHRYHFEWAKEFLSYGPWLAEPREPEFFFRPKVVFRKILGSRLHGTFVQQPMAVDQSLYILISDGDDSSHLKFALGVLLSRIGAWYLRTKYAIYDTLYPWYTKKQLAAFPMKPKSPRVVALVERMLELNKKKHSGRLAPSELERLEREIAATDAEIDELVYELYGITGEEGTIIERSW
jgi:type I restriction-modification system DNA methylase subunit